MEMNFEKTTSQKRWRNQTFCVLGAPKIGKSELFGAGEGSAFLDIEGGLSHLSVVKFPKERPFLDYDELESNIDQLVALKQAGKLRSDLHAGLTNLVSLSPTNTVNPVYIPRFLEVVEDFCHSDH